MMAVATLHTPKTINASSSADLGPGHAHLQNQRRKIRKGQLGCPPISHIFQRFQYYFNMSLGMDRHL